ncbi:MAG: MBL fold metallo-hydrolase, partial [Planctomycetota bacterium]
MLLRQIEDPKLAQYAYLIGCQRTGEAIVFDPERDVDRYVAIAAANGLRIVAVAETHIHADFLSGARELAERTGAHVYVSGQGGPEWQSRWVGPYKHTLLADGTEFRVGNIGFRAVHTPGHTPEHMSFLVTDHGGGATGPIGMVTGDFVFVGDLGRPDLLESAAGVEGIAEPSARELWRSASRFVTLPAHLQVWPAHGAGSASGKALGAIPQSTVGSEVANSPALKLVGDETAFVKDILSGQPEPPLYFARMK